MNKYDDIINFDYQMKHLRMSIESRSASFAPFSALSGYKELIEEAGRVVDEKIELDDSYKEIISGKINEINKVIESKPLVTIKYFIGDKYKNGGEYVIIQNNVRTIDLVNKEIVLMKKKKIKIQSIIDITIN